MNATRGTRRYATALPDATIARVARDLAEPDYALVWKPPSELFARVRPTRAIFNLGAGVDVLLAHAALPEGIPIDSSGGRRNGRRRWREYVTLAVLARVSRVARVRGTAA